MMKKTLCIILMTMMILCSCNQTPQIGNPDDTAESIFTGETIPLVRARNAFYADGSLYYCKNNFMRFTMLESGHDQVLCFDPLCSHDDQTLLLDCLCPAVCFQDSLLARVLVDDRKAWFLATVFPEAESEKAVRYQLRCMDLDSMKTKIYLEKNEMRIWDFWKYGDDIYLLMATPKNREDGTLSTSGGDIYRLDGTKVELLYASPGGKRASLLGSGPDSLYFTTDGIVQQASPDFSLIADASDYLPTFGVNQQIYGGYVYYQKKTGNIKSIDGMMTEGDYDENVSTYRSGGYHEAALYRRKIGDDGMEELVYTPMLYPDEFMKECNYFIDPSNGTIYLVPLDTVCVGYTVWEEKVSVAAAMGITKPILTNVFSSSNGRLVAVDPVTLEAQDVISDADVDVLDIFAVEGKKVMGKFKLNNIEKLMELKENYDGRHNSVSSSLDYEYYGAVSLD